MPQLDVLDMESNKVGDIEAAPTIFDTKVKNQLINTWLKDQGVHLRSTRSSYSNMSGGGLGRNAGKNVSLNKGVHGSRNQARIGN